MATSYQRRPDAKDPRSVMDAVKQAPDRNLDPNLRDTKQNLEKVDEKAELSQDVAAQLQGAMGNSALQGLLKQGSDTSTASADGNALEAQKAQEEEKEVEGDDKEAEAGEVERVLPSFGHAGGGGGSGSPYDMGRFFGGDDDGEAGTVNNSGPRWRPMPSLPDPDEDMPLETEDQEDGEHSEEPLPFEEADERLGDLPVPVSLLTRGLRYTHRCCLPGFSAEKLADLNRMDNAYGRGSSLLRFLASFAERTDAKILAIAACRHPVASEKVGFSGAIAHILALCELVLREIPEGWEPLLEASLDVSTRPQLDVAAAELAPLGKLTAPALLEEVVGEQWDPEDVDLLEEAHPAAFEALRRACRLSQLPALDLWNPAPAPVEEDRQLEAMDTLFASLLGDDPGATGITEEQLQPLFDGMNALLGALGQAQAEVAAAGLVVLPWTEPGRIAGVCAVFDGMLKRVARRLVRVGRELEATIGTEDTEKVTTLSSEAVGVRGSAELLRQAAFYTFASVLRDQPAQEVELPEVWRQVEELVARGKTLEARDLLEGAVEQQEDAGRLHLLNGAFLLENGFAGTAEVHLDWAATLLEKEAPALAAGALLMELGIQLGRDLRRDARATAQRLGELGRALEAPFVVVAAAIAEATAAEDRRILERAAVWLREHDAGGPLNVLKGRWVEMSVLQREVPAPPPIDVDEEREESLPEASEEEQDEEDDVIILL